MNERDQSTSTVSTEYLFIWPLNELDAMQNQWKYLFRVTKSHERLQSTVFYDIIQAYSVNDRKLEAIFV